MLLAPTEIQALHDVQDEDKLEELTEAMRADGWNGRPLLVEDLGEGNGYRAWTGSHRLPAAIAAGLDEIEVALIDTAKLSAVMTPRLELGVLSYCADTSDDCERLALLLRAGDHAAAVLMLAEVRGNG